VVDCKECEWCGICSVKPGGPRASSPKFVVTLDGAGKSLTEIDTLDAGDTLLERAAASARNVVRVKPQTQQALARLEQGTTQSLTHPGFYMRPRCRAATNPLKSLFKTLGP